MKKSFNFLFQTLVSNLADVGVYTILDAHQVKAFLLFWVIITKKIKSYYFTQNYLFSFNQGCSLAIRSQE